MESALHFPDRFIQERLFSARTIMISGGINMDLAGRVSAQLVTLAASSADDITVILNSPGGHVESGDTIHDMIRYVKPRVRILASGWAASAGALIYVAVPREDRYALPNTRFLLHQPMGGVRGQESDIAIEAEQIVQMRHRLNKIFAEATGQPLDKIEQDTNRNFWLTAEEAVQYGLVGHIIQHQHEMPGSKGRSGLGFGQG